MNGVLKTCKWCGAAFYGDGRHKYCSEQCAKEANRENNKLRFKRRYAEKHDEELARNRKYYADNREKVKARTIPQAIAYFKDHPDKKREAWKRYYDKHREEEIARVKAYQQAKKEEAEQSDD